jgi:hypothetical protein
MASLTYQSNESIAGVKAAAVQRAFLKFFKERKLDWFLGEIAEEFNIDVEQAVRLVGELIEAELMVEVNVVGPQTGEAARRVFQPTYYARRMNIEWREVPQGQDAQLYAEQPKEVIEEELSICDLAEDLIKLLAVYRTTVRQEVSVLPAGGFFVNGKRYRNYSLLMFGIRRPHEWLETLYKKDLAVMSDLFVFSILEVIDDEKMLVAVARQGRGCSIRLSAALARFTATGSWKLEWKGLPSNADALINAVRSPRDENADFIDDHYKQAGLIRRSANFQRFYEGSPLALLLQTPRR